MYSVNGDFGEVRLTHRLTSPSENGLFSVDTAGWHRCNSLYQISRPDGYDRHLILITVRGKGALKIKDAKFELSAGTIAFVPKGVPNSYRTPVGGLWEFYWVHPCGELCDRFLDNVAKKGVFVKSFDTIKNYVAMAEELMELCNRYTPEAETFISQKLSELLHTTAIELAEFQKEQTLSSKVINYIEKHFQEPVEISDIARRLYVSPAHLIRTFKRENGLTPHQYLVRCRLLSAIQLLKFNNMSVSEVAEKVGFSSASHFISCFRSRYGCTPTQYNG